MLYICVEVKGLQAKLRHELGVQPGNFSSNSVLLVSLRAYVPSMISFGMLNLFMCLFPSSIPSSKSVFLPGGQECLCARPTSCLQGVPWGQATRQGLLIMLPDHEDLYLGPEHSPPSGFVCLLQLIIIVNLPLKSNSV